VSKITQHNGKGKPELIKAYLPFISPATIHVPLPNRATHQLQSPRQFDLLILGDEGMKAANLRQAYTSSQPNRKRKAASSELRRYHES
jgi:hypothetical protein